MVGAGIVSVVQLTLISVFVAEGKATCGGRMMSDRDRFPIAVEGGVDLGVVWRKRALD